MSHGKPSKRAALWGQKGSTKRKALRRRVIERDGTRCRHCGVQTSLELDRRDPRYLTVDHWPVPKRDLPVSEWHDPARCVIACLGCNQANDRATQVQEDRT